MTTELSLLPRLACLVQVAGSNKGLEQLHSHFGHFYWQMKITKPDQVQGLVKQTLPFNGRNYKIYFKSHGYQECLIGAVLSIFHSSLFFFVILIFLLHPFRIFLHSFVFNGFARMCIRNDLINFTL